MNYLIPTMTWSDAFHRQALSDLEVYRYISLPTSKVAFCHRLHYLQMASEKLVKSYLSLGFNQAPKKSHAGLSIFLKTLQSNPNIRNRLGFADRHSQFSSHIRQLVPVAQAIERLAPCLANENDVNAEYPWRSVDGTVVYPANYGFKNFQLTDLARFVAFLERLIKELPCLVKPHEC